ncbi:MAG: DUF1080 domain-containing protein [Marinicaulis sp.]|nr:DUF1080 domain-containing protein [Marinicaulis sp.]
MRMFACSLLCYILSLAIPVYAQDDASPQYIQFADRNWRVAAREAKVEQHMGREALLLINGRVWLDDAAFEDGVIEFDVSYGDGQGFIGPMWRAENDTRFEELYVRSHLSGKPDAVQYTPVENNLSAWQIFSGPNASAAIDHKFGEWNRVKIVVSDDRADFYFNSDEPVLHIPDLKTDISEGYIGLRASGRGGADARFSNFSVRPLNEGDGIVGVPEDPKSLPKGVIDTWQVSKPFAEPDLQGVTTLRKSSTKNIGWQPLNAETNGIANLARLADSVENADTVFVRKIIRSDKDQIKEMKFGYSDRVRLYVNDELVFAGNAGWRARDYRFLGTVGFLDMIGIKLEKGENEIIAAVSETFGGWAFAGAIEDRSGIDVD